MEKQKDIKGKSDADLLKLVEEKRSAISKFRFGLSGSRGRNVKEARNLRRTIARALTELNARSN